MPGRPLADSPQATARHRATSWGRYSFTAFAPAGGSLRPLRERDASGLDEDDEGAGAERAAAQFLEALGIQTDTESLHGTPGRMARAYAELFSPRPFDLTTFPNDEGYDELVLARRFRSLTGMPT